MEWLILGPLLLVVGVLLAVLLVPFDLRAESAIDAAGVTGRADARWAGGLAHFVVASGEGVSLRLMGVAVPLPARSERRADHETGRDQAGRRGERAPRGPGWAWRNRQELGRMFGRLWRTLGLRGGVEGLVGLGDPADTALLHGVLSALAPRGATFVVAVEPAWLDEALQLRGWARARLWPAHVLVVSLGFLLRAEDRRVLLGGADLGQTGERDG
ncbi:MAG: hypothetical protein H6744_03345 [Deltaproteobacteria bacterium]|nr:hypothetical protein [Deltaproteobacteria bacterium]